MESGCAETQISIQSHSHAIGCYQLLYHHELVWLGVPIGIARNKKLFKSLEGINCRFSPSTDRITSIELRCEGKNHHDQFASLVSRLTFVQRVELSNGCADAYMATVGLFPQIRLLKVQNARIGKNGWTDLATARRLQNWTYVIVFLTPLR